MNFFDSSIVHFLIKLSEKSSSLDSFMLLIVDNYLVKGGIIVSILWYLWFRKSERLTDIRERIIVTLISCIVAIFVGRLLARILPFRVRPLLEAGLSQFYHNKTMADSFDMASSFPSDNSVMFFALATGIFLISKRLGIFSFLYVLFIICLPRIYLGLHYPTDILVGALVGIVTCLVLSYGKMWQPLTKKVIHFLSVYPGLFYILFFLISLEISTLFESLRSIVHFIFGDFYESLLGEHHPKVAQIFFDVINNLHRLL